jgi:hypothetical protein
MAPLPPALYQSGANFGDLPDFPPEDFDPDLEKSSEGGLGAKMPLGATANSFRFDTISEHSTEHDPPNFEKPWEAEGDARSTASAPEPEALSAGLEAPISDPERSPEPEAPRPCRAELEYHALDNFETLRALTGRLDGLLLLNDRERRMVGEYETPTPERAREQLLRMLERSERERLSLVARWWKQGQRPLILHIDDADLETVRRAEREGLSNVITRTSPGSHHIWIRLSDDLTDAEFLTIRRRLFLKLNPSMDPHAPNNSGSYGSARLGRNWKRGGCLIEVISFDLERSASVAALESGGWLAPLPEPSKPVTAAYRRHAGDSVGSWEPDFKLCLKARGGDRFRAGYLFTRLGMTQKGWSADEAATRLEAADPKATHRRGYVSDTVDRVSSDIAGRELEAKS